MQLQKQSFSDKLCSGSDWGCYIGLSSSSRLRKQHCTPRIYRQHLIQVQRYNIYTQTLDVSSTGMHWLCGSSFMT